MTAVYDAKEFHWLIVQWTSMPVLSSRSRFTLTGLSKTEDMSIKSGSLTTAHEIW